MLLDTTQCDAPVTAWPLLDDELTPLEDRRLPDEADALVEGVEPDELVPPTDVGVVAAPEEEALEAELEAPAVAVELDELPGIVAALTALKTPTAATAAKAAPTVSRFSSRRAASRARMRCSARCVFSMSNSVALVVRPNVGDGWEVPGRAELTGG